MLATACAACGGMTSGTGPTRPFDGGTPDSAAVTDSDISSYVEPDGDDEGLPAACILVASNYDQSCSEASDCTTAWVTFGNICNGKLCPCGGNSINNSAEEQYNADLIRAESLRPATQCNCSMPTSGCCQDGKCAPCP